MKKIVLNLIAAMLCGIITASADVVELKVDYSDRSVSVSGAIDECGADFLLGMTVYDGENLINISDCKTDKNGAFSFDKIILTGNEAFKLIKCTVDTGEMLVNKEAFVIFEDSDGKITRFISELKNLSDEEFEKYYISFADYAGIDRNKIKSLDMLIEKGYGIELSKRLKPHIDGIETKVAFSAAIHENIMLTAVKEFDVMQLHDCLFNEFEIEKLAAFNANDYKNLNAAKKEKVLNAVCGEDFSSETALITALNEAIAKEKNTSSSSGGSTGGSSGGGFKASPSIVIPPKSDDTQDDTVVFADIDGYWGKAEIEELASKKIVNGYPDNTFRPEKSVTRAETASIIKKAFSLQSSERNNEFSDVSKTDWYYDCINTLFETGIMIGDDLKINPNDNLTREDMCVLIARCVKFAETGDVSVFSDSANISDYAKEAVSSMLKNGIVQGSDGLFRPKDSITRGELCAVINRTLKRVNGNED